MKISDILKIKWVRDEEFPEKWYDSEICLHVIAKNNNPLASIFTKHGLNVLVINDDLYSELGEDFDSWDKDRKRAAKDLKKLSKLILEQESYIEKTEKFLSAKNTKAINEHELENIRKIFTFLWYIFLSDLGKPLALEVEKRLHSKKLKLNQIETIKDYLAGLGRHLPTNIQQLLDKEDIVFLESVRKCIFIDNYAADLYLKLDSIMTNYLYRKFHINPKDLAMYSFTELKKLIKNKLRLTTNDLEERKKFRIMVQINGSIGMFYGQDNFEKIKSISQENTYLKTTIISGIVASRGIAKGNVVIVKGIKDIDKVKKGNILVASTTRPDLMVALRRCAAIVTDIGGITSHAAIISRELKIPCIVGTKIATKVLKDGDLVEVDANNGVAKILNNAN